MPHTFGDAVIHQSHLDAISLIFSTPDVPSVHQSHLDAIALAFPPLDVSLFLSTAQVNKNMPRTFGDAVIHQSHLDAMVTVDDPLPELTITEPSKQEERIGRLIADNLVQDGATLQMGQYSRVLLVYFWCYRWVSWVSTGVGY